MRLPIALVTGSVKGQYDDLTNVDGRRWLTRASYLHVLNDVGVIAIPIFPLPNLLEENLRHYFNMCDFIVLTGGTDVDPSLHGQEPEPETEEPSHQREQVERVLTRWAIEEGKPVIGICRGMQLAVSFLATFHNIPLDARRKLIHQHLPVGTINHCRAQDYTEMAREENMHPIHFVSGSLLHQLYGETVMTTSVHHQAVNQTSTEAIPGMKIVAQSPDGVSEAFEYNFGRGFVIGVQGHWEAVPTLYRPVFRKIGEIVMQDN